MGSGELKFALLSLISVVVSLVVSKNSFTICCLELSSVIAGSFSFNRINTKTRVKSYAHIGTNDPEI